jgi:hypothetical protein
MVIVATFILGTGITSGMATGTAALASCSFSLPVAGVALAGAVADGALATASVD